MIHKLEKLIKLAATHKVTDIHFVYNSNILKISMRTLQGFIEINDADFDVSLFNYIKYYSNLDLGNSTLPQSGNFSLTQNGRLTYFRFSLLVTQVSQSGVLRVLNNHEWLSIDNLSQRKHQIECFKRWTHLRSGLIILSGPTGSGKTTSLNAILDEIARNKQLKVISLEDPIEIVNPNFLQLQINEKLNFTYEEGIKQLLRHDPDVIMIGEIRDENTAKMAFRCALSGHLVFTTLHSKSAMEAIKRLNDFNLDQHTLLDTISAICNQRLYPDKKRKGRVCIYEILDRQNLQTSIETNTKPEGYQDIFDEIRWAYENNFIKKKDSEQDLYD